MTNQKQTKKYKTTTAGRIDGAYRKIGDILELNGTQAQYYLNNNTIELDEPDAAPAASKKPRARK